jgi:phosphoribosylformimino-5-aminoimidazole carboxamide ribotide isomerase
MELIPAIDLINGKAVRLKKGDFQTARVFHTDPLQFALELEQKGFSRLHMVDLDGAKSGKPVHLELLETIKAKTNLVIEEVGSVRLLM